MTDQAINWMKAQQSMTPGKPFFMYFATGATHAPHHVPADWIAKFHGKFDEGWDKVREATFERQKKAGIIPANTKLPPRPKDLAAWDSLPIDDRTIERMNPALAGRPDLLGDRKSLTLYEGMEGMMENTFMNVKNRSKTITAEIEVPANGASGAILVQGGRFGGWSLHLRNGKPAYEYNFLGLNRYVVESPEALPAGKATVTLDFAYDGGGPGKGGLAKLSVNGKKVSEGRIERTQPNVFSADETADVGLDNQTPVAQGIGYGPDETKFNGKINKVTLEVK